jgi:hypothetical protein
VLRLDWQRGEKLENSIEEQQGSSTESSAGSSVSAKMEIEKPKCSDRARTDKGKAKEII